MIKHTRRIPLVLLALTLALLGLAQRSTAYEGWRGARASVDVAALPMAARARIDLVRRLGVDATVIAVQSVEPTEFPDASLGTLEPNKPYPIAATPGYNIRLKVGDVVYRYWATDQRVVYVESFVEPTPQVESGWSLPVRKLFSLVK